MIELFLYYWVTMLFFTVILYVPGKGPIVSVLASIFVPLLLPVVAVYAIYTNLIKKTPTEESEGVAIDFDFTPGGQNEDMH